MVYSIRTIITLGIAVLWAWPVSADTIITNDGRKFFGEVTPTDTGYLINGRQGMKRVSRDNLKQWIRDGLMDDPNPDSSTPTVIAAQPDKPSTPATTGQTTTQKVNPKVIKALQEHGMNALYAREYRAARDSFFDAMQLDPRDVKAKQGLGLSYYYMGEIYRAAAPLEQALSKAPTDRSIAMDLAAVEMKRNNPMRAVKILRESLAARPRELDVPMYNAIGTALEAADASARKNPYYKSCLDFHASYNARLESAWPGMKHIGTMWLSESKYGPQIARAQAQKRKADIAMEELAQVEKDLAGARRELNRQEQIANTPGIEYLDDLNIYKKQVQRLEDRRDSLQEKIDAASDPEFAIKWPAYIHALGLNDTKTPPFELPKPAVAVNHTKPKETASSANPNPSDDKPIQEKPKNRRPKDKNNHNNKKPDNAVVAPPEPPPAPEPLTPTAPDEPKITLVTQYAAGFAITPSLLVTAADPLIGCKEIQLQNADGEPIVGELVRTDKALGLALVRATNRKLTPLPLAQQFGGGALNCAAFATIDIFAPAAEMIAGTAPKPGDAWKVNLSRHPRLPGAPLMVDRAVVGVVMGTRDTDKTSLPAINLSDLRRFLADVAPNGGDVSDPTRAMIQVMAVREVRH